MHYFRCTADCELTPNSIRVQLKRRLMVLKNITAVAPTVKPDFEVTRGLDR